MAPRLIWAPFVSEDLPPVTQASIAAAKAARDAERAEVTRVTGHVIEEDIDADDGAVGLRLSNFVASAVYGPKGEGR